MQLYFLSVGYFYVIFYSITSSTFKVAQIENQQASNS